MREATLLGDIVLSLETALLQSAVVSAGVITVVLAVWFYIWRKWPEKPAEYDFVEELQDLYREHL